MGHVGDWGGGSPWLPQLSLHSEGRLTGTDGCNRLAGFWTEESGTVRLSEVITTLMFCEGVDTWLSGLHHLRAEGDVLHVYGADGRELGRLRRAAT